MKNRNLELLITRVREITARNGTPKKKLKLILAWAEIHKEDLVANWKLLSEGREYFRIDPLR